MKIPSKNTCAYAICRTIFKQGPRTAGELVSDLSERFQRPTIIEKIADMESAGALVRNKENLNIAQAISRHFYQIELDAMPKQPVTGAVATPRTPPEFRPLTGYKLPLDGARDGAEAHRMYKSRHF